MDERDSHTDTPHRRARTGASWPRRWNGLVVGSWLFAASSLVVLALGLMGVDVPHFPLFAFVLLGIAVLLRIVHDERNPAPATMPDEPPSV